MSPRADQLLRGRTVVVTRSEEQASGLVELLHRLGAATVQVPTLRIVGPADGGEGLRTAAGCVGTYDWLVLTSVNTVERFVPLLGQPPGTEGASVAAIGAGTADALVEAGLTVDLVPQRFVAESLLEAFPQPAPQPAGHGRVLLPRAAVAREVLPEGLRAAGWEVDVVPDAATMEALADALAAHLRSTP